MNQLRSIAASSFFKVLSLLSLLALLSFQLLASSAKHEEADFRKWEKIIGEPPQEGSSAEMTDYLKMIEIQENRTETDCDVAKSQVDMKISNLFGDLLSQDEIKKSRVAYYLLLGQVGLETFMAKKHFSRARPFIRFSDINPCLDYSKEFDSFPSGHTSGSRAVAYLLSASYPERTLLFFKRANSIAKHRVIAGVHFPTDIAAGKKLADYLVKDYLKKIAKIADIIKEMKKENQ